MLIDTREFEEYRKALSALSLNPLPEDASRYFEITENASFLPLERLVPQRARRKGIVNANLYMFQAYNGECPKRVPIKVVKHDSNLYLIVDGNSTYANALVSGWKTLPCILNAGENKAKQ